MENLTVLVLGGSVSGGGGVGRIKNLTWHAQLGPVKPVVFSKNAIEPSYFVHCTDRFVTRAYDVVLLDLGPNMFGSSSGNALEALVRKLRCLSNASSTAIINWPGALRTNASRLAALHTNATFINIPRLRQLYAADKIHPNERGHAFFAKEVRAYLGMLTTDSIDHKSSCDVPQDERCYQNASELPVVGTHKDWKLVDDGIDPSTVHKFGWATKKQGATLRLKIPRVSTCGSVATLAYLRSNTTGSFQIVCKDGCQCSPIRNHDQRNVFPFPIVTGLEDCRGFKEGCESLKVTRETSFNILFFKGACEMNVVALKSQRVRIDGLYVKSADEKYLQHILQSRSGPTQRRFALYALNKNCNLA